MIQTLPPAQIRDAASQPSRTLRAIAGASHADLGLWRLTAVEIDARRRPSPPR
jgi:hypothetical protein